MTATEHIAFFSIAGKDLTRIVREVMLSDAPAKAWRILTTGLRGEGIEKVAQDVLSGKKRLTGDSSKGIGVATESPKVRTAYEKQLQFIYAGRLKLADGWVRPVARVTNCGPDDMKNSHNKPVYRLNDRGLKSGFVNREWHYCGPKEVILDEVWIFAPCGERPFWWPENRTPQEAREEATAAGHVFEERGWYQWYGTDEGDEEGEGVSNLLGDAEDDEEAYEEAQARVEAEIREARYARQDAQREKEIADLRARILAQAAGDLITLSWEDGEAQVPRAPFLHWCFSRRRTLQHLAPAWEPVCPSGLKMPLDDQYHSDWMVGAGLDLYDYHNHPSYNAAIRLMGELQQQMGDRKVTVLVEGAKVYSKVVHPKIGQKVPKGSIVVLPHLSPKYLSVTVDAAAVISEAGGATAHLAQIGRDRRLPMVVVANARQLFPEGFTVSVDTENGIVAIREAS